MPKKAKKEYPLFLKRRRKLVVLLFVFSFFGLILFTNFLLSRYTERVVAEVVTAIIQQESKSKYDLSFERIYVDLIYKQIIFYGVKLELKEEYADQSRFDRFRNTYNLEIPKIEIYLNSVMEIVLNKQLDVRKLILGNPEISIDHFPDDNSGYELSSNTGDLYQVVSGYIKSYRVDNFNILNGTADYTNHGANQQKYRIQDFSFYLENFELDSTILADQKKILYTDELLLTINNEKFNLPDSLHQIRFDSLSISTKDSSISFHNISVEPFEKLDNVERERLLRLNFYDFEIPLLKLSGVDFTKAYSQNRLFIESIFIEEPDIRTDARKKERKRISGDEDNRLTTILGALFSEIIIGQFQINDATLHSTFYPSGRKQQFKTNRMSVLMTTLELDSSANTRLEDTFFYDHFEVQLSNYHFILPDSIHEMNIENLLVSTEKKEVKASGLRLKPRFDYDTLRTLHQDHNLSVFDVLTDTLNAEDIDIRKFLSSGKLDAGKIYLSGSTINIREQLIHKKSRKGEKMELYPIVKSTFPSIDIDMLLLDKSDIKVSSLENPKHTKGEINDLYLTLRNFSVDSTQHQMDSGFFHHFLFETSAKNINLTLDRGKRKLQIKDFRADNNDRNIAFGKASLLPASWNSDRTELNLGSTLLYGVDFEQALNNSTVISDSIFISSPDLKMDLTNSKHSSTKDQDPVSIRSGNIRVQNGNVSILSDDAVLASFSEIDLNVSELQTDYQDTMRLLPLSLTDFNLNVAASKISIPELDHSINVGQIHGSSEAAVFRVKNIKVDKNESSSKALVPNAECAAFFPELVITGLDYAELFERKSLQADSFSIPKYSLKMEAFMASEQKAGKALDRFRMEKLELPFNSIDIGVASLSNGYMDIKFEGSSTVKHYKSKELDIQLKSVLFSDSLAQKPLFLISEHILIEAAQSNFQLVNAEDSLILDQLRIDSERGEIFLEGIRVRNESFSGSDLKMYVDGSLDRASISGFSFEDFLLKNELRFTNAEINMPSLFLVLDNSLINSPEKEIDQKKKLTYGFDKIDIGRLSFANDSLRLLIDDSDKSRAYNLDNTRISALNIEIDTTRNQTVQDVFESSFFELSMDNFKEYLDDSLYLLSIKSLLVNSQDSLIKLDSVLVEPQCNKYEYSRIKNYQTDWIRLEMPYTEFNGVDIISLVEENELKAEKISVFKTDMHVFRDKRIPRKTGTSRKKHPVEILSSLNNKVNIRAVDIFDTNITYEEYAVGGYRSGSVLFGDLNARLRNITNSENAISRDSILQMDASTKLMGHSVLDVEFQFDLSRPGFHNYQASMDRMNLTDFNRMLEYTDFIKVKSGKMNSLEMSVEANPYYSTGEMYFLYEDLKIQFINRKNYTTKGFGKALEDFFANTFVNSKNPSFFHNRTGQIFYERDTAKSIFNYWSKSAFSGIVSSVGLNKNRKELRQIRKGKYLED